jgi:hypothetical protein
MTLSNDGLEACGASKIGRYAPIFGDRIGPLRRSVIQDEPRKSRNQDLVCIFFLKIWRWSVPFSRADGPAHGSSASI